MGLGKTRGSFSDWLSLGMLSSDTEAWEFPLSALTVCNAAFPFVWEKICLKRITEIKTYGQDFISLLSMQNMNKFCLGTRKRIFNLSPKLKGTQIYSSFIN